jgi:NitT/TauT family transport system ATP-binding protein
MMKPTPKLIASDITQTYKGKCGEDVCAVRDLSLQVGDGEFFSLVGPSGCGKTTMIKILAGLLSPTGGSILVDGRDVTGMPSRDRGVVFQEDAVFPWMTVEQNIGFGPRVNGLPPDKVRETVSRYVKMVHLTGFEKSLHKELSGGMRKRVDIARAYANNPDILLMDEPFGSLDSQTRSRMQTELLDIWHSEKKTVVFITHDLEEAIYLSDRVIVLTARPSEVWAEMVMPLGRPRTPQLKTTPEFVALRAHLEAQMAEAIRAGHAK